MQINPVIEKELKTKMRGWKSPALISVYLGFLGLIVLLYFLQNSNAARYSLDSFNPRVSLDSYNTLAFLQLLLVLFITPAMTAGAISGERERQTLDLMLCTNFSSYRIILGKIFVSIAHVLLLITASLPIMSTVFLYGGIGIPDLLQLFGFYLATAVFIGSMGIFYSTIFKKSSAAMIVTYITLFCLLFGTTIVFGVWYAIIMRAQSAPTLNQAIAFMFANPLFAYSSVVDGSMNGGGRAFDILSLFMSRMYAVQNTGGFAIKPWMANIAFDAAASAILIFFSSWKIKPVKGHRNRKQKIVKTKELTADGN